jgi:hypothetical protein
VTKPYNAREEAHRLLVEGMGLLPHSDDLDLITAALNRAFAAGLERAAEIARWREAAGPIGCVKHVGSSSAIDEEARKARGG